MQQSLLQQICRESDNPSDDTVHISSARELLQLATVSYKKVRIEQQSSRERYRKNLFSDILDDMGFFYQQYLICLQNRNTDERLALIREKTAILLDIIEEDLENVKKTLFEHLDSPEEKMVTVVSYILASVEADRESSPCLSKVLAAFATCDTKRLPYFINGLSHGTHPQLATGLNLVREIAEESVKKACKTIIQNRKERQL